MLGRVVWTEATSRYHVGIVTAELANGELQVQPQLLKRCRA
jgi:hypothetical protein